MRRVQIGIKIQRFGENAPDGKEQTLNVYADGSNEYETLCAAFYEALESLQATDGSIPSFGRRSSHDNNYPPQSKFNGEDQHLSAAVRGIVLKAGDTVTFHIARSSSRLNYIVMTDLYDGSEKRSKGGRIVSMVNNREEAAIAAIEARKLKPGGIAILSRYNIEHDCRIFAADMELDDFIAEAEKWRYR